MTIEKARVLAEALPYIKQWAGQKVVVKYGGNAITDSSSVEGFVRDIVLMHHIGICPVVVHGAGPQISELMRRLDQTPTFTEGYRVTGEAELDVVRMALQRTNKEIVSRVNRHGDYAVGISGEDGNLIRAKRMTSPAGADLGLVGEVDRVDTKVVEALLAADFIPVIAPMGLDENGQALNINADHAAAAIAAALGAAKLVFLTDVEGIYENFEDPSTLLRSVSSRRAKELIASGAVGSGMIPKVRGCIEAVESSVQRAHILDGRLEHALLLEIFTDEGIGTMVELA